MDNKLGKKRRENLNYKFTWIPGCSWSDLSDDIKRKTTRTGSYEGRTGCWAAHMKALAHVVNHKTDNVIICEDDALLDAPLPAQLPCTHATYLGGDIVSSRRSKTAHISRLRTGVNLIRNQFTVLGAFAIYYPTWRAASTILTELQNASRVKHVDVFMAQHQLIPAIYYPSVFTHSDDGVSETFGTTRGNQRIPFWVKDYRRQYTDPTAA